MCPHLNTAYFDYFSTAQYEAYMEFDLRIIEACDALFMLPGWADSKGAIKERMRAIELGKTILYNDHELEKYLSEH